MNPQVKTEQTNFASLLISHFGGQKKTADALGVAQPTVSGWLTGAHGISPIVAMRAERKTEGKFKAVDLCPKLKEATA